MGTPYVKESPVQDWVEDEVRTLTLTIPGATSIGASPTAAIYNEQTNTSATNLSSTACTTNSVNTITTSNIQALKGGQTYTLLFSGTVNSKTMKYLCIIGPVAYSYGAA
ncbi:MAG: hypothetical protein KKD77_24625 [Gammaproteobacteria bacterium]|nr:hypothetical protein [Gammaproteobacteria bacterium]